MKGTCKDCRWAVISHRSSGVCGSGPSCIITVLECCFNPPAPVNMIRNGGHVTALRPEVYENDYCAQWTPIPVEEGECNRE